MAPLLEARAVGKVFRAGGLFRAEAGLVAVDQLSLCIDADTPSFITIAGESGSGKTTIARLLLGIIAPTGGAVLYRDKDLRHLSRTEYRRFRQDVQAVFQDPFEIYNPFYKVDHLLTVPVRKFGLAEAGVEPYEIIREALTNVGLRPAETLGRYPHQLSGGQRQRVALARTLLIRPKLIIADEPVSMVDASLRASIVDSMRTLFERFRISFVYVTHDLTTAYQVSQTLIVLYRGTVVEAGDADSVIKQPLHPYTRELIGAIPSPHPADQWVRSSPAQPARSQEGIAADSAGGCPYAARCAEAMKRCWQHCPPLFRTDEHRATACFLHDNGCIMAGPDLKTLLRGDSARPDQTQRKESSHDQET